MVSVSISTHVRAIIIIIRWYATVTTREGHWYYYQYLRDTIFSTIFLLRPRRRSVDETRCNVVMVHVISDSGHYVVSQCHTSTLCNHLCLSYRTPVQASGD